MGFPAQHIFPAFLLPAGKSTTKAYTIQKFPCPRTTMNQTTIAYQQFSQKHANGFLGRKWTTLNKTLHVAESTLHYHNKTIWTDWIIGTHQHIFDDHFKTLLPLSLRHPMFIGTTAPVTSTIPHTILNHSILLLTPSFVIKTSHLLSFHILFICSFGD